MGCQFAEARELRVPFYASRLTACRTGTSLLLPKARKEKRRKPKWHSLPRTTTWLNPRGNVPWLSHIVPTCFNKICPGKLPTGLCFTTEMYIPHLHQVHCPEVFVLQDSYLWLYSRHFQSGSFLESCLYFLSFDFCAALPAFQKFPCSQILAPDGIFTSQITLPVKFMPSGSWWTGMNNHSAQGNQIWIQIKGWGNSHIDTKS